jgi:hypothetical protein
MPRNKTKQQMQLSAIQYLYGVCVFIYKPGVRLIYHSLNASSRREYW